jgi:hypothetical protein
MAEPISGAVIGAAFDTFIGKLLDAISWFLRKVSFSWRVAYRARAAATERGYTSSLKELRLVTRQKAVKAAVRSHREEDIIEAKKLLHGVRAIRNDGARLSVDQLFELLRTGYLGAAEQADRDRIRDEMSAGFDELKVAGGAREALWRANLAAISPVFAADMQLLRSSYGDDRFAALLPNRSAVETH